MAVAISKVADELERTGLQVSLAEFLSLILDALHEIPTNTAVEDPARELTKAGASMAINSGRRDRARAWSRVIYDAYPEVDGLLYGSSMNANLPSIALYERSGDAIPMSPLFHRALGDPVMATTIMNAAWSMGYVVI